MSETWKPSIASVIMMPTTINKVHQSCYRAAALLAVVKELCEQGVPPKTIQWFIEGIESLPQSEEIR